MGFTKLAWTTRHTPPMMDRSSDLPLADITPDMARAAGLTVVTRLAPQDARSVLQQLGLKPYDRPDAQQPHP